jgi:CheY-like chemotaxis protein
MKTILVIEDDRIMRENMAELLDLAGYNVAVAINGKEGIRKALDIIPDLIVCDIKMPEIDGYGVLHVLGRKSETAHIPFIFVTAKTERADRRKGMEMGADDYLTKPFEDTELLKTVETRLEKNKIATKEYTGNMKGIDEFFNDANSLLNAKSIVDRSMLLDYQPKEMIFRSGDYPHFLYFIEIGRAKSFRVNLDGKELISKIYSAGDFFDYQSLFEERVYNESAEALEQSKILKIPKDDFLALIYENRDVAYKFMKIISKNLTEKQEELIQMAYDSVRKRVATKLLEIIPENTKDNSVTISRADMAALVGTTTETLVRTLTELKDLHIIHTEAQKISLLNRENLLKFSKAW